MDGYRPVLPACLLDVRPYFVRYGAGVYSHMPPYTDNTTYIFAFKTLEIVMQYSLGGGAISEVYKH